MFKDIMKDVKETLKTLMTKEGISDKDLETLTTLNSQVDELDKEHQASEESHSKMKDKYIEAITKYGTTSTPQDDKTPPKPRTMEEIYRDVISKKD